VTWVLDASVAVRWFIEEEFHPNADKVLKKLVNQPELFAVPEIFAFEVYAVLKRVHPSGLKVFRKGVIPLLQGGMFREPMNEKLTINADRYANLGLTGYDACYAALARDLRGVWLTFDNKAYRMIEKEKISCFLGENMPGGWNE